MYFLNLVFLLPASVLVFFLVFPFITALLAWLKGETKPSETVKQEYDFGSIITAYRNVSIAKPLVQSLLKQNYENLHVYLVADDCDIGHFDLRDERLTLLRPPEALNLKAKSIIYAMEHFVRNHEYIIVFDADNLAHPQFLKTINEYANEGHVCIQGQRTAKNLDTMYACADATGEFYKNHVERYVPPVLGSSSVISGSGMATLAPVYKNYLDSPAIQQGKELWKKMLQEDKILQNYLLDQNIKIKYAREAIVYDEKVTTADAVGTQRSRWLFSYFQNMRNAARILGKGIRHASLNQFLFGIITIAPPLFILVFLSAAFLVAGIFINPVMAVILFVALCIFAANVLWALYLSNAPPKIWKAIWGLPFFIWQQFRALFKMSNPNKNFKHSEHKVLVSVDDILKEK